MRAEAAALVVPRVREVGPLHREPHDDMRRRPVGGGRGVLLLQLVALALRHGHAVLEPQRHMTHRHLARDGELTALPHDRRSHGGLAGRWGRQFVSPWRRNGSVGSAVTTQICRSGYDEACTLYSQHSDSDYLEWL